VLLGLQQMLKLATLGHRTPRGKSVNRPSGSNQSIESIMYTAAASKMRLGSAARVYTFLLAYQFFHVPQQRDMCGFAIWKSGWPVLWTTKTDPSTANLDTFSLQR
jgi:hypothetical protein